MVMNKTTDTHSSTSPTSSVSTTHTHAPATSTAPSTYTEAREAVLREILAGLTNAVEHALNAHDRYVFGLGHRVGYEEAWKDATKRFSDLMAHKPQPPPPAANSMAEAAM